MTEPTRITLVIFHHISEAQMEMLMENKKESNQHLTMVRQLVCMLGAGIKEIDEEVLNSMWEKIEKPQEEKKVVMTVLKNDE